MVPSTKASPIRLEFPRPLETQAGRQWASEPSPLFHSGESRVLLRKNLCHWMRMRGFRSFEEFAYASQIPKSTISQILNYQRDPRLSTLERFALVLGITVADLFREPHPLPEDWVQL